MGLLYPSGRQIKLALDRSPGAIVNAASYQVNAGIGFAAVIAPIGPAVDLIKLSLKRRVSTKVVDHQLFECNPVFRLRLVFTELLEDLREVGHRLHSALILSWSYD